MRYSKHRKGTSCPGCNDRLFVGHPEIVRAFNFVKSLHPDAHCSWIYRGPEDQNAFKKAGTSKASFGESKHNKTPAEAMDLFQQDDAGVGRYSREFYALVNKELQAAGFKIRWGGDFKSFPDFGHWELV